MRRHEWFLKLDIQKCFDSLAHDVVLETLAGILEDRRVLELSEVIVRAGGEDGRGLPIGNLTSQWFCNLVLDRLDHHVKEALRIPGYLRYIDDFVLFAEDKARLTDALGEVRGYLERTLGIGLKDRATVLAPARRGLPFLGWRIYRGLVRIRPENLRRVKRRFRRRLWEHRIGILDEDRLADAHRAIAGQLRSGNTLELRRRYFEDERCRFQGEGRGSNAPGTG